METKYGGIHLERGKAYLYSGNKEKACKDFNESLQRRMHDAEKYIDDFYYTYGYYCNYYID